jgi:hypothetical protein
MDKDLRDDMLKLVKYRVLFVKREYETAFFEHEDVIEDNLDASALTAWKMAEFAKHLEEHGEHIPRKWGDVYPPKDNRGYFDHADGKWVKDDKGHHFNGLPAEDKKYLRLSFEVLERYPRERFKYEEQQIRILEQMRDKLAGSSQ